jgi:hypothetical protein
MARISRISSLEVHSEFDAIRAIVPLSWLERPFLAMSITVVFHAVL